MNEQENQKMNEVGRILSRARLTTTYVSSFTGTRRVGGEQVEMHLKGNRYKDGDILWYGDLIDKDGMDVGGFTFSLPASKLLSEETILHLAERTAWEREERRERGRE